MEETKQTKIEQALVEFKGDKHTFTKFYLSFARLIKVSFKYERKRPFDYEYDKKAIIEFDTKYSHKLINKVLEIDFDAFYPTILMDLQTTDVMVDQNVLKLMNKLQKYRDVFKSKGDLVNEKKVKNLQNTYIGKMGSVKPSQRVFNDSFVHSMIMYKSRTAISLLRNKLQKMGFNVFFIQTDAVFLEIQSDDQIEALLNVAKSIYPAKAKVHNNFYHWTQTNKYVSIVNGKGNFKSFARDSPFFEPFVRKFAQTQNPQHLLNAYELDEVQQNDTLMSALTSCLKELPSLQIMLSKCIQVRIDSLGESKIKRRFYILDSLKIQKFRDDQMDKHSNLVALHECIIQEDNQLVFDIDSKDPINIDKLRTDLTIFINQHSLVKHLFRPVRSYISHYSIDNKTSVHITFNIRLPIYVQKQIANAAKEFVNGDIDIGIYALNKSLRIPTTANLKLQLTSEQMIQQQLRIFDEDSLENCLFTTDKGQQIDDYILNRYLLRRKTAIEYDFDITINDIDVIIKLLKQELINKHIDCVKLILKKETKGTITIIDNDENCRFCDRKHQQIQNRTRLGFEICGDSSVLIYCYQDHSHQNNLRITIPLISINKNIKMKGGYLTNAKQINQPYLLKNIEDPYEIKKDSIHFIKSHMGSGKSQIFSQLFQRYNKVLLISTRKAFTLTMQTRFGLSDDQIYFHQGQINGTCVCQVESLKKVGLVCYDLIIIDEVQSVLQQIYKEDDDQCKSNIQNLTRLLHTAYRILICDAQLEQSTVDFFTNCFPDFAPTIIENTYKPFNIIENDAIIYTDFSVIPALEYIKNDIVKRFNEGKKTWCIISQRSESEQLARDIKEIVPNINIKIFNGNLDSIMTDQINDPSNIQRQFINNIEFFKDNTNFNDYQLIIHTSSITCGVDVTNCGFTKVIGLIKSMQFNPQQLLQAIFRTRDVVEIELFCQSLQTRRQKSTFYNQFQNISPYSTVRITDDSVKLQSLSEQYIYDLQVVGREYLIYHLQQIGFNVTLKDFEYEFQQQSVVVDGQTVISLSGKSDDNLIHNFMSIIPYFEIQNPYLMQIQEKYKDYQRFSYEDIIYLIELARYQVNQEYNSEGYDANFTRQTKFINTEDYLPCLREFFSQGYKLTFNYCSNQHEEQDFETLLSFVAQYRNIFKQHGKDFRNEYYHTMKTRNQKSLIETLISNRQFQEKSFRYKYYRSLLNIKLNFERYIDDLIILIRQDNLLTLSKDSILAKLLTPEYKRFEKKRFELCKLLGLYYQRKQVRQGKERTYEIMLYSIDYLPELEF